MKYGIRHKTTYRYSAPVHQSYHLLHLTPRAVAHQNVIRHRLAIHPAPSQRFDAIDYFGNPYSVLTSGRDHDILLIEAVADIEVRSQAPVDVSSTCDWSVLVSSGSNAVPAKEVAQFSAASRHGPHSAAAAAFARLSFPPGRPVLEGAQDLMRRIFEEFTFDASATDVSTPIETVLMSKRGVCQDFAHLMIAALRSIGLPARYVSGYILTHPPEGQERLQGADASHAWVSVWAPETGWVDFDPTNNVIPHGEHITIAYGRDYDDVSPISGVLLGGGAHSVDVAVDVLHKT